MEAGQSGVGVHGEEGIDLHAETLKFADPGRRIGGRSRPFYQR